MNYTIKHVLNKQKKNEKGEMPILTRYTFQGKLAYADRGVRILPQNWDSKKQRVKSNHPLFKMLNIELEDIEVEILKRARQLFKSKNKVDVKLLRDTCEGRVENEKNLSEFAHIYFRENRNLKKIGTTVKYESMLSKMEQYWGGDIYFTDIDFEFLKGYETYCIEKKGNALNTVGKDMENLRAIINYAIKKGVVNHNPLGRNGYDIPREKTNRDFLTKSELKLIEGYKPKIKKDKIYKDLFLFSCYTGLRFQDALFALASNIDIGNKVLKVHQIKTNRVLWVPLMEKAIKIISKYRSNKRCLLFPLVNDKEYKDEELKYKLKQKLNTYLNSFLKSMASELGLKKHLHYHLSRHTAATIMCEAGIPIETVGRLLGHEKIATTMIYAKITDKSINEGMKRYEDYINQEDE